MSNTAGIAEVLLANLADATHNVNKVQTTITSVKVRSKWNEVATVRVTDHPADDGSTAAVTSGMALFTSKSLLNEWKLGAAKLGGSVKDSVVQPT